MDAANQAAIDADKAARARAKAEADAANEAAINVQRALATAAAAPPTATVMRAFGNLRRIAANAGRLKITSPNCPKSITRMLRASKLIVP